MEKVLANIRNLVRFVGAVAFWLHAIAALSFFGFPLADWGARFGATPGEVYLTTFFLAVAVLSFYGLGKFAVDVLYVYGFPIVCLYYLSGGIYKVLRKYLQIVKSVMPEEEGTTTWQAIVAEGFSVDVAPVINAPTSPEVSPGPADCKDDKDDAAASLRKRVLAGLIAPFTGFGLFWCAFVYVSDKKWVVIACVVVISIQAFSFVVGVMGLAIKVNEWVRLLDGKIIGFVRSVVDGLLGPNEATARAEGVKKELGTINLIRVGARIFLHRREITYLIVFLFVSVYLLVYVRLVILCTFLYFAVAKVNGLSFTLAESFVTAIFMPLTIGGLPKNLALTTIGGLQSLIALALGVGGVVAYLDRRIGALHSTAKHILQQLETDDVKGLMKRNSQQITDGDSAVPTVGEPSSPA